jgi:hypothetical protein
MDPSTIARELGRLTEAVEGLKESLERRNENHDKLAYRVSKLENKHSWAHGALVTVGTVVGFLGLDRLSSVLFHR